MKAALRKLLFKTLTALFGRERLLFLLSDTNERKLLGFLREGYLHEIGWVRSVATNNIVDSNGDPLPWVTYPFIHFVTPRLKSTFQLFEYGSGNSTLFYSKRVMTVDSVENDREWYEKIRSGVPVNTSLHYCDLHTDGEYARYALSTSKSYNMIIVDGRDRVNCCKQSLGALTSNGVIVLDDSERIEYKEGLQFLKDQGYKQIDFWGLAPGVSYMKCTSIFYRNNNCLDI